MADMIQLAQRAAAVKAVSVEVAETMNFSALTPDALMTYCESRLRGINEQVNATFARQQQVRTATSSLGKLQEQLAWLGRAPNDGIHADDTSNFAKTKELYQDAINAMPAGDEKNRLQTEFDRFNSSTSGAGGDMIIGRDEAADMAKQVATISKDMSSSAELDMIELQSLMSQRQQALQMCTNMMAGLGQSSQQIAANIGK